MPRDSPSDSKAIHQHSMDHLCQLRDMTVSPPHSLLPESHTRYLASCFPSSIQRVPDILSIPDLLEDSTGIISVHRTHIFHIYPYYFPFLKNLPTCIYNTLNMSYSKVLFFFYYVLKFFIYYCGYDACGLESTWRGQLRESVLSIHFVSS